MDPITLLRQKAKESKKIILLPEYEDKRVCAAVEIINKEGIAQAQLLTPDQVTNEEKEEYTAEFLKINSAKGYEYKTARALFEETLYVAAMRTRLGKADGFVAGASHTTPDVARAALRCLSLDERMKVASSCFLMYIAGSPFGENGTFIFADCGLIPQPTVRQLACIAVSSAELMQKILGMNPRVAFLSYSTHGSASGKEVERIREAVQLTRQMAPGLLVDGELQVDAAIVPEVAQIKYPDSPLQGKANILIFPNLEAGNISYKLVQRLANARAVGPLLMGFTKPCSDLSRGCLVEDIIDSVAITALRATE